MQKMSFWFVRIPFWAGVVFLLWFIPWVFVLNLGTLIYFPYKSDGKSRFIRISGPIGGLVNGDWVYNKNIPQFCKQAVVAAEDEKFYEHHGIDPESIKKSIQANKRSKKIKRGGSTITQQIVKNAFLSRHKSYLRKAREIVGAVLLDFSMSKDSQLSWYLNIIEFGQDTYGIKEAARFYFKKGVNDLTPSQCLALVTIIPAPKKWNKSLTSKNLTPFFVRRYHTILKTIKNLETAKNKDVLLAQGMHFWSNQKIYAPSESPTLRPENKNQPHIEDEDDIEEDEDE